MEEQSTQLNIEQLREIIEQFSTEIRYATQQKAATSGKEFYFNFLLRCSQRDGKQYSYAKVWLTESDGTTPFKPDTLYLRVTARGSVLTRDINVSELEAIVIDNIEEGDVGYAVTATANSYDPDAESTERLDDCARP